MKRVAIVDDSDFDLQHLKGILSKYFAEKNITSTIDLYRSPTMFLDRYTKQFDLIFFDIEMPGMSGIELATKIREIDNNVKIIFTTMHPKYAIDGYGLNALSFFVKPISYESLCLKMNHLSSYLEDDMSKKISFKYRDNIKTFYINDINYIIVNGHYLTLYCEKEEFEIRGTLAELENQLNNESFARCNNYCIVNLSHVDSIENNFVIIKGNKIDISKTRKKQFLEKVLDYYGKVK